MVHVGDERFYQETYDEAFSQDVALVEGVDSRIIRNLTRSYRWIALDRLHLVQQPKAPLEGTVSARIVKADLSPDEFAREWQKVGIHLRAMLFVLAPLTGIHRWLFSSRRSLADDMCLEDLESADEILRWRLGIETVRHAIRHARDRRLIECMISELESPSEKRVAIIYGAGHMRAVLRELTRRGFRCSDARWKAIIAL